MCQVVTYKSLKTMENHSTFRPKKWSWSLTGGGKVLAFWIGGHLHCMGGGRLWEVDRYGSSTVVRLISSCLEQTSLPIKDPLYGQRQIKLFHRKNMRYTKVSTCSYRSLLYLNKITSFSREERNWKKSVKNHVKIEITSKQWKPLVKHFTKENSPNFIQ